MTDPTPTRILIIKPSALGDIVHALPILNLLRKRWPAAHIAWLVNPAFADLLEGNPQLNEVIRFDRRLYGSGWRNPMALTGLVRFLGSLRHRQFDLVIDLQGLFRSGFMTWITGASRRMGFADAREGATFFYTDRIDVDGIEQHALDRMLTVAAAVGCEREPVEFLLPRAPLGGELLDAVRVPYAVLLPATNWATKRWPVEYFAALIRPLRERFGLEAVIAGAADAAELAKQIQSRCGNAAHVLAGKTLLPQLVTLLEGATIVIANDSGPMHIASALNRPLVTLFGPTNPLRTGPYRRPETVVRLQIVCSPCYSRTCSHQSCLQWLTPEMVLREIGHVLR